MQADFSRFGADLLPREHFSRFDPGGRGAAPPLQEGALEQVRVRQPNELRRNGLAGAKQYLACMKRDFDLSISQGPHDSREVMASQYLGREPYWLQYIAEAEAAAELAPPPASRDAYRVVLASAPCSRRCRPGTPWSAWWWAPTRAAVRGYTPSHARWRRRERAPSGGRWARGASGRGARDLRARRAPPLSAAGWLGQRVLAVVGARHPRPPVPAIGRPNAEILHHGPPPAYARGQAAVGGAEPWPRVHPGRVLCGVRAAAGL